MTSRDSSGSNCESPEFRIGMCWRKLYKCLTLALSIQDLEHMYMIITY